MQRIGFCFLSIFLCSSQLVLTAQGKINASTFGVLEARSLGPGTMSGRITAIQGVNTSPKTVYIGTAGGGVWKTTNAGASFKPIFDKYCQSIGAIAIDPSDPNIVYVGTGESNMRNSVSIGNGIYKSTDAGDNWMRIGLDSTEHISKIIIDPKDSKIIYVAVPGPLWSDSPHRGLYKSMDGGKSWTKVLYVDEKTGCADIAVHPQNPNIIYATTWQFRRKAYAFESGGKGSAIYKSEDAGLHWKKLNKGLPEGDFGRVALTLAPSAPDHLLAIVESKNTGLYISEDGGDSWKSQSATLNVVSRPFYFSTLVIDPTDAKRVYRPAFSFSYSDDGGYSWSDASNDGGWVHSDHHALWIDPKNTDHMYLGTDGGVYISNDRGVTWIFCGNLPVGQFYRIAVDQAEPFRIYGGLQDNGSWVGPSAAPGGISNGDWKGLYWGDGFWTVPDPTDSNIAYAESQGGSSARIDMRTFKSYSIKPQQIKGQEKLRWNWNAPIVIGSANPHHLYVGAQYLFKSTDQGRNWEAISPDLSTNDKSKQEQEHSGGLSADVTSAENHCTIYAIAESPLDEKVIWVGTDDGNIQLSQDGGKSWTLLNAGLVSAGIPKQAWVSWIEPSRFNKQWAYACFDNHTSGDHITYLAKTEDMGKSWKRIMHKDFTGFAHRIIEDPVEPRLLFLGTEMGLFASLDHGSNWFRMKNNIPEYALVRDIQIHKKTSSLVIGTHGRGIYVLDDIRVLRTLSTQISNEEVVLFDTAPMELTTGTYGGSMKFGSNWIAPNPSELPPISYYLKERQMTSEIKIEIVDMDGKLVQSLPGTNRKGINQVTWNQRMKPGRVAEGGTKMDFAAFSAPKVLPGKYQIRLLVNKDTYLDTFELYHKDAEGYTIEDRKSQFDICMRFYHMHEQLARIVEDISSKQKWIKEALPQIKNSKNKMFLNEYDRELETLRSTLLATKQKSIFADEQRLRERISDAYGAIVGEQMKPSRMIIERAADLQLEVDQAEKDKNRIVQNHNDKFEKLVKSEKVILKIKS